MHHSTFVHHFDRHIVSLTCLIGAISVCSGALVGRETMDDEAAWAFFLAGTVWVIFCTTGLWVLQTWAPRRAVIYALYSAFAGNVGICTFAVAAFAPVFLLPSTGSTAGLILLEYFFVALGYQLWSTWRHFNAQGVPITKQLWRAV